MVYIHEELLEQIEKLKNNGEYESALKIANDILVRDPKNEDVLLQIADIEYMKGDLSKAEKPVDFLLKMKGNADPISFYVKGVLEMEKTNWSEAKKYLRKALELIKFENPEMMRCYALCEYWQGNREKGMKLLDQAFEGSGFDAEIVYNIIEISLIEKKHKKAQKFIDYFYTHREKLNCFGRDIEFYDEKINLFNQYLKSL